MRFTVNLNILEDIDVHAPQYYYEGNNIRTIRRLAGFGCRFLDFSFNFYANKNTTPENSALARDNWREWIKRMRHTADEEGIVFTQGHSFHKIMFDPNNPFTVTPYAKELEERIFEACCILGIPHIIYHPVTPAPLSAQKNVTACREINLEYLTASAHKAASYNICIAVENMIDYSMVNPNGAWNYAACPEELAELVDNLKMQNVFVCLDTGHANLGQKGVCNAIEVLGSRIRALHIHDNMGQKDQHVAPFYGAIDWESVLEGLVRIGYRGDLTYEVSTRMLPHPNRECAVRHYLEIGQWLIERFDVIQQEIKNAQ